MDDRSLSKPSQQQPKSSPPNIGSSPGMYGVAPESVCLLTHAPVREDISPTRNIYHRHDIYSRGEVDEELAYKARNSMAGVQIGSVWYLKKLILKVESQSMITKWRHPLPSQCHSPLPSPPTITVPSQCHSPLPSSPAITVPSPLPSQCHSPLTSSPTITVHSPLPSQCHSPLPSPPTITVPFIPAITVLFTPCHHSAITPLQCYSILPTQCPQCANTILSSLATTLSLHTKSNI
ncbi:hypothetical protein Pcinc_044420 [Petrolisthes cinctipes]|uniref:Uncharacterized protein n=1 Tax=Petrolisthes cinctipes TaxID=88211 RepID=A0AAE1EEH8_PETCI|nr:hypothetical protein Pcinc_044420 [Petrolisthes cinctipes]